MTSRAIWFALLLAALVLPAGAADFYVAPDGDDNADGSMSAPFATLTRARDAVRAMKNAEGVLPEACNVFVRGKKMTGEGAGPTPVAGPTPADDPTYVLDGSFALGAEDSGMPNARVTYRAYPGEEVRIAGGRAVTGFAPVSDAVVLERIDPAARDHVRQCDLKAQGIDGWGDLPASFRGGAGMLELFFDDRPMTLARWPNEGFVTIEKVIDAGPKEGKGTGGVFTYSEDRASRWTNAPDLYLQGYWCHDWFEENIRVESIDTAAKQITLGAPHNYGIGGNSPRRYYAFNILEEIDEPGEWYLDRATDILYFWPPSAPEDARVWVSLVREPLINMQDCSNVGVEGFILEIGRGSAVRVEGGAHNRVAGCTIRNVNGGAISVSGGEDHGVIACDIYATGAGGVSLTGGDRASLTPCNHFVENCHIHHYARHSRTYSPAVSLNGVGCRASHNLIHDAPHMAMGFGGNDHLIEYNDIYRVCTETDDAGAIYTGRNWTTRGTLIRHNSFRDIGMATSADGMARHFGAHSVYLDDCASGTTSFGNVFVGSVMPILIGGGRENAANNNVFVRCQTAIRQDARGLGWAKEYAAAGGSWLMYEKLNEVPYQQPPWSTRYPELSVILDNDPPQPRGTFRNNIAWGCGQLLKPDDAVKPEWMTVEGNVELPGEEGVDDLKVVRKLVDGVDGAGGFEPIPLEEIGLRIDSYRPALPDEGTWAGGDAATAQARAARPGIVRGGSS